MITIKLSPDQKILAIQRSKTEVQFTGILQTGNGGNLETQPFSQACKSKGASTTLLGFSWLSATDIVYFTNNGFELYSVMTERKTLKSTKTLAHSVSWHIFSPTTSLMVVATNSVASSLQPFQVKPSGIYKLPKIEYDRGSEVEIRERDLAILSLYTKTYVAVIAHRPDQPVEVHLHTLNKESSLFVRNCILEVPTRGNIALNVVDDLVVVHHQSSLVSYCFDIHLTAGSSFDGTATHFKPVCSGQVCLEDETMIEMYSPNWKTFFPNIIVDAKVGKMWKLKLALNASISAEISDLPKAISFLQQRTGTKQVMLDLLFQQIPETKLSTVGATYDIINEEYMRYLDIQLVSNLGMPAPAFPTVSGQVKSVTSSDAHSNPTAKVIIDQSDFFTHILSPFREDMFLCTNSEIRRKCHPRFDNVKRRRLIGVVTEYLHSMGKMGIASQYYLHELIVNLHVLGREWYQIQQMLQYKVISDSKPMACLLLSLEKVFPASFQLAMDMLKRLGTANDEICEILLSKGRVISALTYAKSSNLDHLPPRKFLEAALECDDQFEFFNTFDFYRRKEIAGGNNSSLEMYAQIFTERYQSNQTPNDTKIN